MSGSTCKSKEEQRVTCEQSTIIHMSASKDQRRARGERGNRGAEREEEGKKRERRGGRQTRIRVQYQRLTSARCHQISSKENQATCWTCERKGEREERRSEKGRVKREKKSEGMPKRGGEVRGDYVLWYFLCCMQESSERHKAKLLNNIHSNSVT